MAIFGSLEILVAIFLFVFLFHYWMRNIKAPIFKWPIVGMLPGILYNACNIHDYLTSILKYYGGTFKFQGPSLTNMTIFFTCDPHNVHHITSKNFSNYVKGSHFLEIFDILGDGILNSDSEKWQYNRAILHSLFKRRRFELLLFRTIQTKVESCLLPFFDHVSKEGIQVDLQDAFQRFTFDNICNIVLGFDPNCLSIDLPVVAYEQAFNEVEVAILYRHILPRCIWKLQNWLQIGKEKKFKEAQKIFEQFLHEKIVSKLQQTSKCRDAEGDDLITILMEEEGINGKTDYKFLRDTACNLMAAGKETISSGLSWFFWLVATHPYVEAKILEEMRDNFPTIKENWRALGVEELSKFVYLHGAVCEALRLYPPVPFDHKCALKSDILPSGDCIEPNTMIIYSLYSMGRMKEIWGEDCLEFKPERWISEKGGIIHVPSYKFITFSAGPRSCLGKKMSFIEMKMVATAILWNYHIKVVEDHQVSPGASVLLRMKHGLKVRVTKRCI